MPQTHNPMPSLKAEPRVRGSRSLACAWVADLTSWAVKRLEPGLRKLTVIVLEGRRVVGVCAKARKAGVQVGDALDRARVLCPDAALAQLEPSALGAAWDAALETMHRVTPWIESVRPGMAYLAGITALDAEALASELDLRVGVSRARASALLAALAAREHAAIAVSLATKLGLVFGMIAGFLVGIWDEIIMRVVDAMLAFPFLVLAITLAAVLGPNLQNAMLAIAVVSAPVFARLARGQVLAERERDYVQAAHALGSSEWRIVTHHLLPNIAGPVIIQASLSVAGAILAESSLSFLGLGVQPPTPSWGEMLNTARGYLRDAPWTAIAPGSFIFISVLAFNLLGDGLRDALDPKGNRKF